MRLTDTTANIRLHSLKDLFYRIKEIREIAIEENLIIVTKDSDFEDYYFVKGAPPRILLLAIENCSNTELIKLIDRNLDQMIQRFNEKFDLVVLSQKEVIGFK